MRILLDECVTRLFRKVLQGHNCPTAPDAGFAGLKSGRLLRLAEEAGFDVFLTIDQGIAYQQNLSGRRIIGAHPRKPVKPSRGFTTFRRGMPIHTRKSDAWKRVVRVAERSA